MNLISVDIETTGLDPEQHEVWEVAVVPVHAPQSAYCYQLPVTLAGAEKEALEIGRFEDRYLHPRAGKSALRDLGHLSCAEEAPMQQALRDIYIDLSGARLLGCSVHFDARFLEALFRRAGYGVPAPWHHRHLDLGSFAGGAWGAKSALSSQAMTDRIPNPGAHDALADARWNVEVYRRIVDGE
jgi:DNA polymerase III epsilon subunit-like protein